MLRGEDFELIFEGKEEHFGFYTTRVVKAVTEEEAETKAVALVKKDKDLISSMLPSSSKEPMIYLESISKAPFWRKLGGTGYSFWPMENESL